MRVISRLSIMTARYAKGNDTRAGKPQRHIFPPCFPAAASRIARNGEDVHKNPPSGQVLYIFRRNLTFFTKPVKSRVNTSAPA
jgi:hypothetical protein